VSYRQSPLRPTGRGGRGRRGPGAGLILLLVVILAGAAATAFFLYPRSSHGHAAGATPPSSSSPSAIVSPANPADALALQFAQAWTKGDLTAVPYLGGLSGAEVQSAYKTIVAQLQAVSVDVTAQPTQPTADASIFSSVLNVTWHLPGAQTWTYQSTVDVNNVAGSWQLAWKPSVVQSSLGAGDTLQYTRLAPTRATIQDGAGQPIVEARPVVDIGLEAGKVLDPTSTASQMSQILGVDAPSLVTRIKGSTSDEFVDVITLREPDYEKVAAQLAPIPGLVLRDLNEQLSPSHDFARSLIGTVGPVTKEIVDASNGRYISGDVGGLGGLEKDFDATLSGSPGYQISALHQAAPPTVVHTQPPVQGTPLRTTLDQTVQAAADAALSTVTNQPSALVAVRVSTGQVIAVANGPAGGGFDAALLGQIVPGSAFKIVTTTALLEQGFNVNTAVPCVPQIVVFGKTFHNYEGEQLGSVPFHTDFAKSCNTAFISLAPKVPGLTLSNTAQSLGIGACWSLGTPAFRGSVSPPKDATDLAATSFGQGSTLVSPVSLAVAVATVARGHYIPPQLVVTGKPADCSSGSSAAASPGASASPGGSAAAPAPTAPAPTPGPNFPANVITQLHSLMREVVTVGTGSALIKAPGGPVMGKTGTAEYGPGATPKTHAWFVGYQGDIAFAVYVQDGQSGGTVAAPVALSFLQDLAGVTPTATPTAKSTASTKAKPSPSATPTKSSSSPTPTKSSPSPTPSQTK
jgi:cell division protein FtsI/penicillin-binding protein 2